MTSRHRRTFRFIFLLLLSLAVFLPFVANRAISTSHEARVVQVARQMAAVGWPWEHKTIDVPQVELAQTDNGLRFRPKQDGSSMKVNPWIVPVINGQVRLQKPPLPYWCAAILFRLIPPGEGAARLPPAFLGAISVLLIWDLARMLMGNVRAWFAAIVWVSSYFIVDEHRKAMADPYLAFFTLAAIWTWVRAVNQTGVGNRVGWLWAFYLALALGTLAKGPLIFVFVIVILVSYHLCHPKRRLPRSIAGHGIGLVAFTLIAAPWFVAILTSIPHAIQIWRYESIGEMSDNTEKARAWWFYLPQLFQISLPWTPLCILGIALPFFRFNRRRIFLVAAAAVILLVFSLSYIKKNAYLLPMMPLYAFIVADGLMWLTIMFRPGKKHRPVRIPMIRATVLAVVFGVAVQVLVSVILRKIDNLRSAKDACRQVRRMLAETPRRSVFISQLPEEASVYLPFGLKESTTSDEVLMISDDRKGDADEAIKKIKMTPSGPVVRIESTPVEYARNTRWKVFRLIVATPTTSTQPAERPPLQPPAAPSRGPGQ